MIWFDICQIILIQIFQCCFCSMRPCPILEKDVVTPRKVIHFSKHTNQQLISIVLTIYLYSRLNKKTEVLPNLKTPTEIITFFGNVFLFKIIRSVEISPFFVAYTLSFCVFLYWLSLKRLSSIKKVLLTFATVKNLSNLLPLISLFSLSA